MPSLSASGLQTTPAPGRLEQPALYTDHHMLLKKRTNSFIHIKGPAMQSVLARTRACSHEPSGKRTNMHGYQTLRCGVSTLVRTRRQSDTVLRATTHPGRTRAYAQPRSTSATTTHRATLHTARRGALRSSKAWNGIARGLRPPSGACGPTHTAQLLPIVRRGRDSPRRDRSSAPSPAMYVLGLMRGTCLRGCRSPDT